MSFPCEPVCAIRVFQRPLGVPIGCFLLALFVVFRSSAMGLCCKFVLLGGLPVFFVHDFPRRFDARSGPICFFERRVSVKIRLALHVHLFILLKD